MQLAHLHQSGMGNLKNKNWKRKQQEIHYKRVWIIMPSNALCDRSTGGSPSANSKWRNSTRYNLSFRHLKRSSRSDLWTTLDSIFDPLSPKTCLVVGKNLFCNKTKHATCSTVVLNWRQRKKGHAEKTKKKANAKTMAKKTVIVLPLVFLDGIREKRER